MEAGCGEEAKTDKSIHLDTKGNTVPSVFDTIHRAGQDCQ